MSALSSRKLARAAEVHERLHELLFEVRRSKKQPKAQRDLARTLLEAAFLVALKGEHIIPVSLAKAARGWWNQRTRATKDAERARRIWGSVLKLTGQLEPVGDRTPLKEPTTRLGFDTHRSEVDITGGEILTLPRRQRIHSMKLPITEAFGTVADAGESEGTAKRRFYQERSRREASGGWTPEESKPRKRPR